MTYFEDLGLAEPILQAVTAEGYKTPTPIQTDVIPAVLKGSDILGIAQTGTGKTAAFVLPLLHQIHAQQRKPNAKKCTTLILTPTRELAAQITANIDAYSKFIAIKALTVVGGVKPGPQIRALTGGAHIVVATPGRLLDHMNTGAISLADTKAVVLDEADQMLDLGFMPAIRRIFAKLPKARQTILMSATMPDQVRAIARDFQTDPQEIAVAVVSRPIERIEQSVRHTVSAEKRTVLTKILSDSKVERAIVFTRTKRGADRVSRHLTGAGLSSAAIHGNKSQSQRQKTLAAFKAGKTTILVATDIAARGIDVDGVSHVVNYELPNVAEAYVHRIGRTARAGKTGTAISLCDPSEQALLHDIEKLIGNELAYDGVKPAAQPAAKAAKGKPRKTGNANRANNSNKAQQDRPNNKRRRQRNKTKQPNATKSARHQSGSQNPSAGLDRMLGNIGKTKTDNAA